MYFIESTHIRILAFSPAGMRRCDVSIGKYFKGQAEQTNDNLFVVRWHPRKYRNGLHKINVICSDKHGREEEVNSPNFQKNSFEK